MSYAVDSSDVDDSAEVGAGTKIWHLAQVRDQQQEWVEWLKEALPAELRGALVNVVQKREELTVLAVSAAWSARAKCPAASSGRPSANRSMPSSSRVSS